MGTRTQFFTGDPQDLEGRKWLGTLAWDGYPDGDCGVLAAAGTEEEFLAAVAGIKAARRDFCDPAKHGFPFPWTDNLFLTDFTYAFFGGRTQVTNYARGWIGLADYLADGPAREAYDGQEERLPEDVPAPTAAWDRSGPDSIIVTRA